MHEILTRNIYIYVTIYVCNYTYTYICNYGGYGLNISPIQSFQIIRPDQFTLEVPENFTQSLWSMWFFIQWIGLRENLQETIDFPIEYGVIWAFPVKIFP